MRLSHGNRASCKVRVPVFVSTPFRPENLIAGSASRPFRPGEFNRWLSVQTPSDRSIDHTLVAWQSGILQSQGARFCVQTLLTEESNRRFSAYPSSDCSIGHALAAWQSGILQSRDACFCRLILPTRESNRGFSVQTPSDRSIDHALVAWQSGILQSQGAHFCMLSFRPRSLITGSVSSPSPIAA